MSDPIDPVQEMQKLDDIEADLADTAMAVVATDEPSLVSNAEAVEHVLEQAIPDAPVEQAHTPPSFEGPVSSAVEDAQAAIDVVQADVINPILPDVKELPAASPSATPVQIPSDAGLPPRPESNGPLLDLPEGLTSNSPSVVSNREAVAGKDTLSLFNWSVQKSEVADARAWYKYLANEEPTAIQPLLSLINLELALSNFSEVEALFATALNGPAGAITAAADVSIWKAYLHYIRRQNPITEANSETVRSTITNAYEYALRECGTDRESGEIWQEYIAFISEPTPGNTWETQQQVDALRKIYSRAVRTPLNNVEALWKAYDAFESGNNKSTAKKFLAERSPAYMTARTALRELRTLTDSLPRSVLPPRPTFNENDRQLVSAWKAYLKWEEGNPLVIDDTDVLAARVGYALRKCLGEMRHYPELWHYAANYYADSDKAAEILSAGIQACPSSVLLAFALADAEEDRKNFAKCHAIYDGLINRLYPEIEAMEKKVAAEVDAVKGPEVADAELAEERENRGKLVAARRGKDVADLAACVGVVWVMYMRFARRAEGIKAARGVFGKARKSPYPTWHVFEASAMMEYHANKDSAVAIRIFELGFKLFSEDVDYVVRYLNFLLSINDDTNARALFERSAVKIPAEKARPLWDAWARYEYMFGDLSGVHKLEARFAEVFPNDSPLKRFAQRFTYNGLDQIALRDLGFGSRQSPPSPPPKRPLPDSPRPASPVKRQRAESPARAPPPPPQRFRDRTPRSPPRREQPPVHVTQMLPQPPVVQAPMHGAYRPLIHFIGSLPSARSFDGPVFRPDDIMGLFSNISREGIGAPPAAVYGNGRGYNEPRYGRRY